ncbi:Sodium/hydrogen exchanger family-domain-containing protein, partial [Jimgerdemannia flammicorona]
TSSPFPPSFPPPFPFPTPESRPKPSTSHSQNIPLKASLLSISRAHTRSPFLGTYTTTTTTTTTTDQPRRPPMSDNNTNNTNPGDTFEGQPVEEELYSSWALLILTTLLIGALWTSYYLQLKKIRAIHETVASIVAGMLVGLALKLSPGHIIQKMVTFNQGYFFNLLLPPIILNSGYELKRQNFFRNFGTILTFAFAGTFITAIVTGIFVFIYASTGLESLSMGFLDSMIFGSILSATDPVTILAIFSQLKVDPKLYSIIFGESILNDAVAIVLSQTLVEFRGMELHLSNIVRGFGMFFGVFSASLGIGIIFGLSVALMLKHSQLYRYPSIEACLISLMAYSSYLFSNGISMSGAGGDKTSVAVKGNFRPSPDN